MKRIPFIVHLLIHLTNKCAGTARATSSIIESGQKDTEASILLLQQNNMQTKQHICGVGLTFICKMKIHKSMVGHASRLLCKSQTKFELEMNGNFLQQVGQLKVDTQHIQCVCVCVGRGGGQSVVAV